MNETALVSARANVMLYDQETSNWVPSLPSSGPTIAKISLYFNPSSNSYRIVGWRLQDKAVVINCSIPRGLKYHQARSTFHQWRDSKHQVYGLNFIHQEEAEKFAEFVHNALENLAQAHKLQQQQQAMQNEYHDQNIQPPSNPNEKHYLKSSNNFEDKSPSIYDGSELSNKYAVSQASDVMVLNQQSQPIRYPGPGPYAGTAQIVKPKDDYPRTVEVSNYGEPGKSQAPMMMQPPSDPPKPPPLPGGYAASNARSTAPPNPPPPPPPPPPPAPPQYNNNDPDPVSTNNRMAESENSFEAQLRAAKNNKLRSVTSNNQPQVENTSASSPVAGTLSRSQGADMMSDLQRVLAARRKARESDDNDATNNDTTAARKASCVTQPTCGANAYPTLRKNSSPLITNGNTNPSVNGNNALTNGTTSEPITRADLDAFKQDLLRELHQIKKEIIQSLQHL